MSNNISRKEYIDALRALAIVIVVYSHCVSGWTWFFLFIGPIMMPLFFEISGYVFKIRDGKWTSFFINLFKRVVVPWFFLVFSLLLYPALSDHSIKRSISAINIWAVRRYGLSHVSSMQWLFISLFRSACYTSITIQMYGWVKWGGNFMYTM